jgi:hypothetical protein
MRTPVLDAFIERTLDEYVPGHASGTRIGCAVAIVEAPDPECVDPNDVLDDDEPSDRDTSAPVAATAPAVYVPAIRRFAPPRRA